MEDDALFSLIATQNLLLQAIHAELRALRLEQRALRDPLSEADQMELETLSVSADCAAELIGIVTVDDPPGEPA